MSQTHSIVCHATREKLWIGQGTGPMTNFYSGEKDTMEALSWFLEKNREHPLNIVCDDLDNLSDYLCWSGTFNDWLIERDGISLGFFSGSLPEVVKRALEDDSLRFMPPTVKYYGV